MNVQEGQSVAVATTNLNVKLPKNTVLVKDYGENEGMLAWLHQNGVVGNVLGVVPSGFVTIPVVELLWK